MTDKNGAPRRTVGGLDEVGWGALAGPIITVVAVFGQSDLSLLPPGVRDSKKTTEKQRDMLYLPLCRTALDVGIGHAWPFEIDSMGPTPALQLSYARALDDLCVVKPDQLIVDGSNRVLAWKGPQIVEPKADLNHPQVSAASIIAKWFRDRIMRDYALERRRLGLPDYSWDINKGYGTSDHMEAIRAHGFLFGEGGPYLHRKAYCRKLKNQLERE